MNKAELIEAIVKETALDLRAGTSGSEVPRDMH